MLLRRALAVRIGATPVGTRYLARLWTVAVVAAAVAWGVKLAIGAMHPIVLGLLVLGAFGLIYLAFADPANLKRLIGRRLNG